MMKSSNAVTIDHCEQNNQGTKAWVSSMPPILHAQEFWTTDETASYLRCEAQTIRKAISQKSTFWGLKPRRVGRRLYFAATEVRALLEVV
jgi:hypothetical protein